jgi:UDP-N-acetylmuramyl pentapeptide synthase
VEDLIASLRAGLAPGVTVLVKGSRSNRLERVAAALGAGAADGRAH